MVDAGVDRMVGARKVLRQGLLIVPQYVDGEMLRAEVGFEMKLPLCPIS